MHQEQEKSEEKREDTADPTTIQRNQEHITNQISKKKDTQSKSEECERRNSHLVSRSCHTFGDFCSKLNAEEKDDDEEYDHCRAEKNTSTKGQKSEDNKNEIPESRKMRYKLPSTASKKAKRVTVTEYALKTSKGAAKRRKN